MSISKLFDGGFLKRNRGHFASIVRVAIANGEINDDEKAFLDRLATKLDVSEQEYKAILKDPNSHPINPPTSYEKRLERLFDLARMVRADDIERPSQVHVLEKLCVGLGFSAENVKYIADKALSLIYYEVDIYEFTDRMKKMNQ